MAGINDYIFQREVGRGGMGCVFDARVAATGQRVAIKMLRAERLDADILDLFNSEVAALRRMHSDLVVNMVGEQFSDTANNLYIPMEFVEGETLSQRIGRTGPMGEREALQLMLAILEGIAYIHSVGVIHRDLKPSNIMLRPDGKPCIIDFGIVRDVRSRRDENLVVGTDGYMSPEQENGLSLDRRADIYAAGCLLRFMLTGSHTPTQIPASRPVLQILERATDPNMLRRYATADEMERDIERLTGDPGTQHRRKRRFAVSVGRSEGDIIMGNGYVSARHLTIECSPQNDGTVLIDIRDHSTNGTFVNGRLIRHDSFSFIFDGDTSRLPQVWLYDSSNRLPWESVLHIMTQQGLMPSAAGSSAAAMPLLDAGSSYQDPQGEPQLDPIMAVLAFALPPVGLILGIQRKEQPQLSRQLLVFSITGSLAYIILLFIIILSR